MSYKAVHFVTPAHLPFNQATPTVFSRSRSASILVCYFFPTSDARSFESRSIMKYQAAGTAAFAALTAAQNLNICPTNPVTVYPTAVVYPLAISTYISAATVFNINGNANITINNAPTTIQTIIQATTTIYNNVTTTTTVTAGAGGTGSSTVSNAAAATGTNPPGAIILAVNGAVFKRQNGLANRFFNGYSTVAGCGDALRLNIRNGQLFDSSGFQYSTSTEFSSDYFVSSGSVRTISTTFATDNGFSWFNAAFTNGQASFCQDSTGGIRAVFRGATPVGCTPISFTALAGEHPIQCA